MSLPKGITKLPPGVEIHGQWLRIRFSYRGRYYREPITTKITKGNIEYAKNKRQTIKNEILEGRFDYAHHFPNSPNALKVDGYEATDIKRTVEAGIEKWLKVQEAKKAPSTFKNYKVKAKHVQRKFQARRISDVTKSDLELFQTELLKSGLNPKTVNDIFTIVRGVWADAFSDGLLKSNPLERINNLENEKEDTADPFTSAELEQLGKLTDYRPQDVHLIMFNCWAGLSVSEAIALAWEDVDTTRWTIKVQRARVHSEYKVPKERSRVREVELIDPAIEWLKRQKPYSFMQEPHEIRVRQRDNVTFKYETVRFVFLNAISNQPWYDNSLRRWQAYLLRKAGIRHRGPNQCRHTFASQLLSRYVPQEWIARQLGHSDTTMIKKHYGKWIPDDSPSMARWVSEKLSDSPKNSPEKNQVFS
ncbi:Arm DNA-binding domain-containing protein [Hahella sp. HN01]|uniref:Arm DNA-binding domain-containing protein n=1 Tax=Hahella sp. HN01 TaxID=2847262 RepID=UPI001C1F01C1|nr:DUF3596 domain-containing protein [Hahella sp. HN01]MBU6952923.1 DUF3596 domain-containing protein [Hahella sp. HN01]